MHVADLFHLPRYGHELSHVDVRRFSVGTFVAVMLLLALALLEAKTAQFSHETTTDQQIDARFLGP